MTAREDRAARLMLNLVSGPSLTSIDITDEQRAALVAETLAWIRCWVLPEVEALVAEAADIRRRWNANQREARASNAAAAQENAR